MSVAFEALRWLFLPLLGLGVAAAFALRGVPPGPRRNALVVFGALCVFLPQLAVLLVGRDSPRLYLHFETVLALWMLALGAAMVIGWPRLPSGPPSLRTRARRACAVAIGLALAGYGAVTGTDAIRDILGSPTVVEGVVTHLPLERTPRRSWHYVVIDGRRYEVPWELWRTLHVGDALRVELLAGSGVVLAAGRRDR